MVALSRRSLLGAGAVGALLGAPSIARARTPPNVLFIAIDDLNDWIQPLGGYDGVQTPNFERLARISRCYRNAYTPVPVCSGARTSVMFGLQPYHTGVYTDREEWEDGRLLRTGQKSLPRVFRDAGYDTIGTGKVFSRGWRRADEFASANDPRAWSEFEFCGTDENACSVPSDRTYRDADNATRINHHFQFGTTDLAVSQMEDAQRARWLSRRILGRRSDRPFFGAIGLTKPHLPFTVPGRFFAPYPPSAIHYPPGVLDPQHDTPETNADLADLPLGGLKILKSSFRDNEAITGGRRNYWKDLVRSYLATISFTDFVLGMLLDALERGPNADNTIVALWSDHGWQLGEKLGWRKATLWERATRVPMFIGGAIGGRPITPARDLGVANTLHIFPTLCDLALGEIPTARHLGGSALDGVSLRTNLLEGAPSPTSMHSTWMLNLDRGREQATQRHFSIRNATHRLIRYGVGGQELYDHRTDPYEWSNLMAEPTRELTAIADEMAKEIPRPADCVRRGAK